MVSWDVAGRTCYACPACQPTKAGTPPPVDAAPPRLFNSHCAGESLQARLATPAKLRVAELRDALGAAGLAQAGKKAELVARLEAHLAHPNPYPSPYPNPKPTRTPNLTRTRTRTLTLTLTLKSKP